jgi:hypothetical protein
MVEELVKAEVLKGGEFVVKDATPDTTFIPEEFNEEQKMIRQMVRDFATNVGDRGGKLDKQVELLDEAAELGLLGSHIPEEYSGMPMDTNTNSINSSDNTLFTLAYWNWNFADFVLWNRSTKTKILTWFGKWRIKGVLLFDRTKFWF